VARAESALPTAGISLAAVGLILLTVEVVRVVTGSTLGTLGAVLLWVGVGFVAIGMLLIAWTLLGLPSTDAPRYAGPPATTAPADDAEPAPVVAPARKTAAPSTPPASVDDDVDLGGEG
jgi:hypothetical protein